MATHSSILAWKIPGTEEPGGVTVHGVTKSWAWLSNFDSLTQKNRGLAHSASASDYPAENVELAPETRESLSSSQGLRHCVRVDSLLGVEKWAKPGDVRLATHNCSDPLLGSGVLWPSVCFCLYSVWRFLSFKMVSKYLICMQFSDESTSHPVFPSEASRIFVQRWSRYLYP